MKEQQTHNNTNPPTKTPKRVPKLRFKEFSDDWDEKNIANILQIGSGRDYKHLNNGLVPVYGTGGLMTYVDDYLYNGESVCIGRKGTIDKPVYLNEKFWTVDTLFYTHSFKKTFPKFVYNVFQNINWKLYNEASGVPSLSKATIEKIKINIPNLEEQQKIATFLTSVDKKIDQLQQKKHLLEHYKKGVMQQLFSQQLRFKDDNGNDYPEWVEKRLGNIGETLNGLTGKTKEDFVIGKPYIQYKQIFDSSKINIRDCGLVEVGENENQTKVQFGDAFFTTSSETANEIGTTSVLLDEVDEMYLNSFCFGLRISGEILNPSFSQFLFRSAGFRRKMIPLAQGSTRYNISKGSFLKLRINIPSLEEQTKIANFLSAIDTKIALVNTQIENTQLFKKGLLQQMFV
ncbi:MAG TPA: restriction endonuclease subunit S [Flavobacteriaceae bacterium]|nr:restriction endonuclease subunit S [Flavobacteriaceae bacterium]